MTDSTTPRRDGSAPVPPSASPSPSDVRAERRRLVESIGAVRRLLSERRAFEIADQRRLRHEARQRERVETAHGEKLHRIEEERARQEASLAHLLGALDGERERREGQALSVLRRQSVERALGSTYLTASEVNGIGAGLVRSLSAQGIRTAADFDDVSWGKAPNGKGGDVLYLHRTKGGKIHINGIGEHRGRPLLEWRRAALARAQARAPHKLPPDERHRITEIIEAERVRLRQEAAEVPRTAEAARAEAVRLHAEALGLLDGAASEAARLAAVRRAEFDAMAERLRELQDRLSAHIEAYGDVGRRVRRAQKRALRPVAEVPGPLPGIPSPRTPEDAATGVSLTKGTGRPGPRPVPGVRASPGWLVPVLYFALTAVVGVGEMGGNTAHPYTMIVSRLVALAAVAELLRLWLPRVRARSAGPMPDGTGWQTSGVFLALTATGMFEDEQSDVFGAACVVSVLAAVLFLAGTASRVVRTDDRAGESPTDPA
ncbi:hypothetical protein [Streptomyces sp. NRRL S-37]|uniref:hypothetical protein n=1 Tax=Streptomyces sp. NRRL S-37 TaxID=1463903 RepID=UPI00131EA6A1|nr:hypothetical protein [Streptomyces sp. NRRL S-37]